MNNYYKDNKDTFIENTINCDMSTQYSFFLKYMPKSGTILDLGFGSGRDMKYFKNIGYNVIGIDSTDSFVELMKTQGYEVYLTKAQDMTFVNSYEGIWACASLLHIPTYEMVDVLNRCYLALKENGVMYCSFKHGEYEGERNGRFFLDLIEERFRQFVSKTNFEILEIMITNDVRPDRTEKWLNVVLKK